MQHLQPVVDRFGPALANLSWHCVPGGFSGAEVWRGDQPGQAVVALKAWPPGFPVARLTEIHGWMKKAGHLPGVPTVLPALNGNTIVSAASRMWDATRWMPGSARERPNPEEVEAACATVADLHGAWRDEGVFIPSPGVRNRLQLLREFLSTPSQPGRFPSAFNSLKDLIEQTAKAIVQAAPSALRELEPWEDVPFRCQPCIRDLRGEHVLFTAGRVTGIIDYGAMAVDHPAVDLARFLGDCAGVRDEFFALGLHAYREAGGGPETSEEFLAQLSRTGSLGSAINWLRRWQNGDVAHLEITRVAARLSRILQRIERFAPG